MCGTFEPLPSLLMGEGQYYSALDWLRRPRAPSPPGGGRGGWGETRGRSAPLRRTPTPPSPIEGEGPAPRLSTTLVPNSIGGGFGWGWDLCSFPHTPTFPLGGGRGIDLPLSTLARGKRVLTYPCQLSPRERAGVRGSPQHRHAMLPHPDPLLQDKKSTHRRQRKAGTHTRRTGSTCPLDNDIVQWPKP
jgi:hypothetical protein